MSKSEEKLCDWSKKDFRDRLEDLRRLVAEPRYVCIKCGRASSTKAALCKPKTL